MSTSVAESRKLSRKEQFGTVVQYVRSAIVHEPCPRPEGLSDFDELGRIAQQHGVLPLVWAAMAPHVDAADPAVRRFKNKAEGYAANCMLLFAELLRIVSSLEQAGITAAAYKGPALAEEIYGNLALRQSCDLDLIVRPEQIMEAKQVLSSLGYERCDVLTQRQEHSVLRSDCEFEFIRADKRVAVEVHWRAVPAELNIDVPPAGAWDRRSWLPKAASVPVLSPEDLMLALCAHGMIHSWRRLIWIADIAACAQKSDLQWLRLMEEAKSAHAFRVVAVGVLLAHELFECHVPMSELQALKVDSVAVEMAKDIAQTLWNTEGLSPRLRHMFALKTRERMIDKGRYCWRVLRYPQIADFSALRLPDSLFFLYPFVRMTRLTGKLFGFSMETGVGSDSSYGPDEAREQALE